LYKAAGPCGRAAVVALLLSRGAHVDAQTKYGRTPLMEAASWASIETVEILLRAGANPNATDREGRTPLMCVGDGGPARSAEVFRLLVAAGGNVHARAPNGMTALTHAQSLRCPPCVDVLLARGARL
jgi:ankyrin repeat protein